MKYLLTIATSLFCILTSSAQSPDSHSLSMAKQCLKANRCKMVKRTQSYEIYQNADGMGFGIIGYGMDGAPRLLGYSPESTWDEDNMPPALLRWLNGISNVNAVNKNVASADERVSVAPLLTSHWHQDSPYNDLAPVIEDGNVKTVAGCVAIAAAQVVYYWRCDNPEALLKDTPVYPYSTAPVTMSIPKGTPNNWDEILDSYDRTSSERQKSAVAQLVYAVGTGSYLNYASETSGSISSAKSAIYSQYRLLGENANKNGYSQEEWENLLYTDLKRSYPIIYSGSTSDGSGHAIVLDGYDADQNLFHFNFGWGGSGDGYYTVADVNGVGGYGVGQSCVYNIHPKNRNIEAEAKLLSVDDAGKTAKIELAIANKSTLPIESLYAFSGRKEDVSSLDDAVAMLDVLVPQGESPEVFAMDIPIDGNGEKMTITITDSFLYPMATLDFSVTASIENTESECGKSTIYTMDGMKVGNMGRQGKGIYIVKTKDTNVKVRY